MIFKGVYKSFYRTGRRDPMRGPEKSWSLIVFTTGFFTLCKTGFVFHFARYMLKPSFEISDIWFSHLIDWIIRKCHFGEYLNNVHLKGIGGPGAPHCFRLEKFRDTGAWHSRSTLRFKFPFLFPFIHSLAPQDSAGKIWILAFGGAIACQKVIQMWCWGLSPMGCSFLNEQGCFQNLLTMHLLESLIISTLMGKTWNIWLSDLGHEDKKVSEWWELSAHQVLIPPSMQSLRLGSCTGSSRRDHRRLNHLHSLSCGVFTAVSY